MQLRSTIAVVLLVALSACAHRYPVVPPTVGFYGRVDAGRPVRCVYEGPRGIDGKKCAAVQRAVNKINAAVGYQLLAGPFWASEAELKTLTPDLAITYVIQRNLPYGTLGLTAYSKKLAVVALSPDIWASDAEADSVVLHELLHSIGAGHAEQEGNFESVERPMWKPGAPTELTPGDVAALRAAYAQL